MQELTIFAKSSLIQQRYEVDEIIGRGGSGVVYKALDTTIRRWVAIKQIVREDGDYRRFVQETRILGGLNHPGLPDVYDCFVEQAMFFLVMELIEGDTLADFIARQATSATLEQVLEWAKNLGAIVAYLHNQNPSIIHRDIKPQNIKITASGSLILLDFGLAQGSAQVTANSTLDEAATGFSPNYAALEQRNGNPVNQRSDVYAVAATLYYALTGFAPCDSLERAVAIAAGLPDPLIELTTHRPELPVQIFQTLHKALALNPDLRHPTITDFIQQLLKADSVQALNRRWVNRLAIGLAGLIGLVLLAYQTGLATYELQPTQLPQPNELSQLPSPTSQSTPTRSDLWALEAPQPTLVPTILPISQLIDPAVLQAEAEQLRAEAALWTPIFTDTFDLNRHSWPLTTTIDDYANSTLSIKDGKLIFDVTSITPSGATVWDLHRTMPYVEDFVISVDITCAVCEPSTEPGLLFRESGLLNAETYYFLRYGINQRVRIAKQLPDKAVRVAWDVASVIDTRKNLTNHVELIVKGDHMAVFINNQYALKLEDSSFSSGYPHIFVWVDGATTEQVTFDNLYLAVPQDQVNRTKR